MTEEKQIDSRLAREMVIPLYGDKTLLTGETRLAHADGMANIVRGIRNDEELIAACYLFAVHDCVQSPEEWLKKHFGNRVCELVIELHRLIELNGKTRLTSVTPDPDKPADKLLIQAQDALLRKMVLAMCKDLRVVILRLASRLQTLRWFAMKKDDPEGAKVFGEDTLALYAPLANRLGIYSLKWELEDLAFKYLYPDEFHEIVKGLDKKRDERLAFIDKIMEEIRVELKNAKITAEVTGRAKHIYSIYRKMQRDNSTLDQIYDLFALRILVNSVRDCYAALGVVHDLYNPMPGRFKDYISVPKKNMYQSIHTTLIGPKGTPFEVQIRTWEMHRIAEFGIAAHWAYKEQSNKGKKKAVVVKEDKLAWLRETLEWQKDTKNPEEFMNTLKKELFEDEVHVFTPKGDIKVLPRGSTPIDLAYAIHEQVGHRMVGAKINSKMMPIITPLKNGDIVEIITSDSSKGPSRDWLKFVKSSGARTRIQQWFKRAQREENIENGKNILEKDIKKLGMKHSDLFKPEWVQVALDRYKYNSLDDMYASIGFGAISATKILARLLEEYRKEHKEEDLEKTITELATKKTVPKPSKTGVVVEGIDNCLVKLSKCCNPLPGDPIVGYITKGRGVSVHRMDCVNVKDLVSDENRIIDVYWANQEKSHYSVDITVYANDRQGLLADIIKEITTAKFNILGVNTKTTKEKIAIIEITLELENLDELNRVMKTLKKVDTVFEVKRNK